MDGALGMEIVEAREGGSETTNQMIVAMRSARRVEPCFMPLIATRFTKHSKYQYVMVISGLPFGVK